MIGVIVMGTLFPRVEISESYVFLDAQAIASMTFNAQGNANVQYDSEVVTLFKQNVYGFSFSP